LPVRYGLTIGGARPAFQRGEFTSVPIFTSSPLKNWHRNYFFESTGIKWIPPSPNLRLRRVHSLPRIEILQNAGVSVGRGTQTPFEEFGAPWLNGDDVASALNGRHLPGLHFTAQPFIPIVGLYSGERCGGVVVRITERGAVRSMRMGLELP